MPDLAFPPVIVSLSVPALADRKLGTHVVFFDKEIPSRSEAELVSFSNSSADPDGYGTPGLQWTILCDGFAVPGFNRLRDQAGTPNQPQLMPEGSVVAKRRLMIIVENDAAAAYVAQASLTFVQRGRPGL